MIPHERSLVEKLKNKPFALIGVNSDGTDTEEGLAKFREKVKEASMTWRSFRDESTDPKISDTWRVQGWPTLYYIDHEGVIRHKGHVPEEGEMEKVLEEMIAAAEKAAAEKPAPGTKSGTKTEPKK